MNAKDLILFQWVPAIFTRQAAAKTDKRAKEAEETLPWWAYRRPGHDTDGKTMDIQGLNLQTSSYKKIG